MKTKVIAMYLPQYHEIEENSLFWGKGYTDWVGVKKAKPFLKNQIQPRIPLNNNYYDLSQADTLRWQVNLAKKYGVYGFGIYHYWFNDEKNLLTKPAENLLANKDIEMPFFFAWDNTSWKRTWSKIPGNDWAPAQDNENKKLFENGKEILVEYVLGEKPEWEKHFNYLLPFFKDKRYIKINEKPLFFIFRYSKKIVEMINFWDELAKQNGFAGMSIALQHTGRSWLDRNVEYLFDYEPSHIIAGLGNKLCYIKMKIAKRVKLRFRYDWVWKNILRNAKHNNKHRVFDGGIVAFDDTPRRGEKARILLGSSPEKFYFYLKKLLNICSKRQKEYVFITAWNEWGEGAYLEPDSVDKYAYLEAIKKAVDELE